jgi:transposase
MKSIPRMSRNQRRELIHLGRTMGDAATALRFHMIAELGAGHSRNQVARKLAVAVSTVVTTPQRYVLTGLVGIVDQRVNNGRRKVESSFLKELREVLQSTPQDNGWTRSTWTRELLCEEMVRRGCVRVAVCTMGRALKTLGARLGRPKPIVLCPWPAEKRKRRLAKLKRLAASDSAREPVYYSDEVDIDLNPKIGRDWMLSGQQRRVLTPGQNQKHYLAGALRVKSRRLAWAEGSSKTSTLFCKLLWRLASMHRRARRVHIILDNYGIHKSKATRRVLNSLGSKIVLHFLPPYCPDHNPIERVWLDLHSSVTRNHRCRTMRELGRDVIRFLDNYDGRRTLNPALRPRHTRPA